jgi:hypothetical protein
MKCQSTVFVNGNRPLTVRTPADKYAIIAAVEGQQCCLRDIVGNLEISQARILDHLDTQYFLRSASLSPDARPLRLFYV